MIETNKNEIISFITECLQELRKVNTSNAEFNSKCVIALDWLASHKKNVWYAMSEALPEVGEKCLIEYDNDLYIVATFAKVENKPNYYYFVSGMFKIWTYDVKRWASVKDILDRTNTDI